MENNTKTKDLTKPDFLGSPKFKLAVVILIFYLAFIAYLVFNINISETHWGRYLFLFAGIEAIVFAAVGYVFGRDVSRRAEANAIDDKKEAKKEKDQALKEKQKADKKTEDIKEDLIRLQEAVLSENQSKVNFNLSSFKAQNLSEGNKSKAQDDAKSFNSRAMDIVLKQQDSNKRNPIVSFNYKVEVDGFQSIIVDGKSNPNPNGFFSKVQSIGKTIDVSVQRENLKTWKFTAFDITDRDGNEMKMSNSPLESNGTQSTFYVEYVQD